MRPDDEVAAAYTSLRSQVVRDQPADAADRPVPHCLAWSVGDLLATLVAGSPVSVPIAAVGE